MIDTDQIALLKLLKAALFDISPHIPADDDWDNVLHMAEKQAVTALAVHALPGNKPAEWKEAADRVFAFNMRLLFEQSELVRLCREHAIPLVIIKGAAAAIYYPKPILRTLGDIDFFVPEAKFTEMHELLLSHEYELKSEGIRHNEYLKNGIELELHHVESSRGYGVIGTENLNRGMKQAVTYSIQNYSFPGFEGTLNGLILLEHVKFHLLGSGLGLRQVIDWMMYVHSCLDNAVWEAEFQLPAREAGLEKLAVTLTYLCRKWLGLSDEITWCAGADDKLANQLLEYLFLDGNFGREKPFFEKQGQILSSKGLFRFLQQSGLYHWEAAKRYPVLRPFAWAYQLRSYTLKYMNELIHGKKLIHGMKLGAEKAKMLKQLGIE